MLLNKYFVAVQIPIVKARLFNRNIFHSVILRLVILNWFQTIGWISVSFGFVFNVIVCWKSPMNCLGSKNITLLPGTVIHRFPTCCSKYLEFSLQVEHLASWAINKLGDHQLTKHWLVIDICDDVISDIQKIYLPSLNRNKSSPHPSLFSAVSQ